MRQFNCGVYTITNTQTGRLYVGSSKNLSRRFTMHKSDLNKNKHCSNILQYAWNKYGPDTFEFNILLYCSIDNLLFYEQRAIDTLKSHKDNGGYNINPIAGSCEGRIPSDNHCKNISKAKKGIKLSDEHRLKLSMAKKGKPAPNKGMKKTEEQRKAQSERMKGKPSNNIGKKLSDETKAKISKTLTGRKQSKETIAKRSAALKGHIGWNKGKPAWNKGLSSPSKGLPIPDEIKKKISEAKKGKESWRKGKKMSEEDKQRRREAMIAKGTLKKK